MKYKIEVTCHGKKIRPIRTNAKEGMRHTKYWAPDADYRAGKLQQFLADKAQHDETIEKIRKRNTDTINDFTFTNRTLEMRKKKDKDYWYNQGCINVLKKQNEYIKKILQEKK